MKGLYQVQTGRYITFYVTANGFDHAKSKVEEHLIEAQLGKGIIDADGSLQLDKPNADIKNIQYLGDKFIN